MSAAGQLIELDGSRVSLKGEMVSLTGLWKAAGSDPSRKPAEWLGQEATKRFVDFLATSLEVSEVGENHFGLVKSQKGGASRGVTWAHWQVALAYAKYLSPEFRVRCNAVVRAHMERRLAPASDFPAELIDMIKRTDGIVRMLAHKVTTIEKAIASDGAARTMPAFTITVSPASTEGAA
ncbi:KilA-N domain-containing protein [Antarcticirhabdus aurantiaca]|uniref:KilA-N domain-containing protein n=1 Tax=Antarcticirhabdus aurantiaca TaxID=2606717 RepID=A0ACD4NW95_9HYPH|nr:KilA-N domain-containing protein [Jeongeuplla avenae]